MADVSIANLPAFVGVGVAANDFGVMVDVDDTSESPLGTTKRFTFAQVTSSIPGSVTIGGNLTVAGTSAFNGRVTITFAGTPLAVVDTLAAGTISSAIQMQRNAVITAYLGSDASDNFVIARGADGVVAFTVDRVTGKTTVAHGLVIAGAITPFQQGALYTNGTLGLVISGVTGSTNDFTLAATGGAIIMRVPTGSTDIEFAATVIIPTLQVNGTAIANTIVGFRFAAGVDANGWQWTNNAQTVEWMRLFGTGLTVAGTITATSDITSGGYVTLGNGKTKSLRITRNAGAIPVETLWYDAGTDDLSMQMGGTILRWRDTGAGVPMSLTATGILMVGALQITANLSAVPGDINFNGTYGFIIRGKAGSSHDFAITNPGFTALIMAVPTGTNNVDFSNHVTLNGNLTLNTNNAFLIGKTAAAVAVVVIGVDSADRVIIDNSALGVRMGGSLTLLAYGGGGGLVSVGAVDSGGVGFRVLRVPN